MTVVDAHLHLFESISEQFPRDVFPGLTPPERRAPMDEYFGYMERAGVDKAVIVSISHHDEYVRDVVATRPDLFAIVGVQDVSATDQLANYRERRQATPFQGFRLFSLDPDPTQPADRIEMFPVLEQMADDGVKLWFYATEEQVLLLDRVLDHLPELTVVINHLGFCPSIWDEIRADEWGRPRFSLALPPKSLQTIEVIAARPNVYVHLSGQYAFTHEPYPHPDLQSTVDAIHGMFGAERMLWASDYPWIAVEPGYPEQLALVDHYLPDLSAADRDAIRGGNAMRLFDFS
ncbi:MAG: amidohydrolase family protein [Acidimicrobiia bacterium]|nr:amidohydrolase family protein [Acidimicrobiia bacterium]